MPLNPHRELFDRYYEASHACESALDKGDIEAYKQASIEHDEYLQAIKSLKDPVRREFLRQSDDWFSKEDDIYG